MIEVAIVDDHKLFLESFALLVQEVDEFNVWGKFSSAEILLDSLHKKADDVPHVIFLDLKMKGMTGFDCLEILNQHFPEVRVIILSMFDQAPFVQRAANLGAMGFVNKESDPSEIKQAILSMHRRGYYLPEALKKRMITNLANLKTPGIVNDAKKMFSKAELRVLGYLAQGLTAPEIGAKTHNSPRTIEGHKQRLLSKTGQKNTVALMVWAFRNGLII